MPVQRIALIVSLTLSPLIGAGLFDYDKSKPLDVQVVGKEMRAGVEVRDITFASLSGGRTPAYLVVPQQQTKRPAILFIHWYEPPNPTSNRTQFLAEAVTLARSGVISLLPATLWSEPEWFKLRRRENDLQASVEQTRDLRRAMDVLLSQPGVDANRVALVGHDFGAMFGAILANVDRRAKFYALQAGTGRFHHWYLFGPPMPEPARTAFMSQLKAIDPVEHISQAGDVPVLFQFATADKFVPKDKAEEFIAAAPKSAKVLWYDAGHGLNEQAVEDRIQWLRQALALMKPARQ